MRRALLIITAIALLCFGGVFAYRTHDNYRRSEECVSDTLDFIRELYDIKGTASDEPFLNAYRFQEHVTEARRLLSRWVSDPQSDRHRIVEAASGALSEYERAAQLYMQLNHRADKELLAEFTVKIDSGRQRLAEVAAAFHKHPPPLTTAAKQRLIGYIDGVFGTELAKQNASKNDPRAQLFWEIVAVSLIRRDLQPTKTYTRLWSLWAPPGR
jgi:hypothetical protein